MADEQGSEAPDLAGYPDVASLAKGYRESGQEAKKWRDQVQSFEQRFAQLEQRLPVPQRDFQGQRDPAQQLEAMGVPIDALGAYVANAVSQGVQATLGPLAEGMQARSQMVGRYKDYNKFESDVAEYVNSDPELSTRYQKLFRSDPVGAMEYAYLKFGETQKSAKPTPSNGAPKKEAAIPQSRSGSGSQTTTESDDNKARAWEHYQKTGNPEAYAKARFREAISDEFLSR